MITESTTGGELAAQVAKRRTFAIISHPDAGKSTLTSATITHLRELGLEVKADGPLYCVVSRLTAQKGLHLVLHRALRAQLEACLDGAQRSVEGWLRSLPRRRLCVVDCTDIATSFLNVNTPEDFHAPAG